MTADPADPAVVHGLLLAREQTVATAESLTGGGLGRLLTDTPGSSATYVGGFVVYATRLKTTVLGVPEAVVETYGVVSPECAVAMARSARDLTGATYAISTTGVAGPDAQEGRPPGTVFVGLAGPGGASTVVALELVGGRAQVRERTCREALSALGAMITSNTEDNAGGNNGALG